MEEGESADITWTNKFERDGSAFRFETDRPPQTYDAEYWDTVGTKEEEKAGKQMRLNVIEQMQASIEAEGRF